MRRGRSALPVLALALTLGGCYSYAPAVADHPVPATTVEVVLNDRGRIAMENHIGADVLTVEGSVAEVTDSSFVLRVQRTVTIGRQYSRWAGEPVTLRHDYVRQLRERRFSAGRTGLLAATAVAGLVTFVATPLAGSLLGEGGGPNGNDGGPVIN